MEREALVRVSLFFCAFSENWHYICREIERERDRKREIER